MEEEEQQEQEEEEEEDVLEFDLEEEMTKEGAKFYAIGLFYSEQSFSRYELFNKMVEIWGLKHLAPVRDVEEKEYMIEFASEAERRHVTEGGPWTHKSISNRPLKEVAESKFRM